MEKKSTANHGRNIDAHGLTSDASRVFSAISIYVSRHECGIRILTLANNDPTLEMPWSSIFFGGNSLCIEVFSWENRRYLEALVGRQAGNGGKVIPLNRGLDGKNHGTNGVDLPAGLSPYGSSCTFSGSTTGVWFRGLAVASQTVFGSIWSTGYPQHWT